VKAIQWCVFFFRIDEVTWKEKEIVSIISLVSRIKRKTKLFRKLMSSSSGE
jgi:hypothetical protein